MTRKIHDVRERNVTIRGRFEIRTFVPSLGFEERKKRNNDDRTLYRHECEPVTQMRNTTSPCCGMRGYASFGRWALSVEGPSVVSNFKGGAMVVFFVIEFRFVEYKVC